MDEGGGEVEAAAHPARVGADRPVEGVHEIDQLAELTDAAVGLALRQAVEQPLQPEQFGAGLAGIERGLLEGDADAQPHGTRVGGDVEAGDRRLPTRRSEQRAEHAHGRRLPRPVRAEEAVDLAGGDVEVDAVDREDLAELADQ